MNRTLMQIVTLTFVAWLTFPALLLAGVNRWTTLGPLGPGSVRALMADSLDPSIVYYTSDAGIFRSDDGGSSWHAINNAITELNIWSITMTDDRSPRLYAGTRLGSIFRSTNRGDSWTQVARLNGEISSLAYDGRTGTLYALAGNSLYRSTQDAETWQGIASPDPSRIMDRIASANGRLYASVSYPRPSLYVTDNFGITWRRIASDDFMRWGVDADSSTLVVATRPYGGSNVPFDVRRSHDGGQHFDTLPLLPADSWPAIILPYARGVVMHSYDGIFRLHDSEKSWQSLGQTPAYASWLVRTKSSPARLIALEARDRAYARDEDGQAWSAADTETGKTAFDIRDLAVPQSGVFAVQTYDHLLQLNDAAGTWTELPLRASTIVASAPHTLLAAAPSAVAKSDDAATTWHQVSPAPVYLSDHHITAAISPANIATLYAALDKGLAKSSDGGENWQYVNNGFPLYLTYYGISGFEGTIAADPREENTAYASALTGFRTASLYKTSDGGAHWMELNTGVNALLDLAVDRVDSSIVYAYNASMLLRTLDGGITWQALDGPRGCNESLITDPTRPATVYLGGCDAIYRSTDTGEHWERLDGSPGGAHKIVFDQLNHRIYAVSSAGVHDYEISSEKAAYTVSLRTAAGNLISAADCGGREAVANARFAGPCETWTLFDLNGGELQDGDRVQLQATNRDFWAAENGGASACGGCDSPVNVNRRIPSAWETFTIHKMSRAGIAISDGDSISLQSFAGDYVAAENGGSNWCDCHSRLNANRAVAGPWETFTLLGVK